VKIKLTEVVREYAGGEEREMHDPINCGEIVRRGVAAGGESWIIARIGADHRLWAGQSGSSGEYRPIQYLTRAEMLAYTGSTSGGLACPE
jgi:hypothetical protein